MSKVIVNGMIVSGGNITIMNNKVFVDGKDVTPDAKEITITVEGDVSELTVDACSAVSVTGNVNTIAIQSGSVQVTGSIQGSVKSVSGSVSCGGSVRGSITTVSGSITHK